MRTKQAFFQRPRLWGLLCGLTLVVAQFFTPPTIGIAQAATPTCTPNGATLNCTITFNFTGAPESWTVPAGVTQATFDLYGARGGGTVGTSRAGFGGRALATLAVTPGATYQIRVGGSNGFNGGGTGNSNGGSGGGASDVRNGAFGLADRLLVAGGGGGTGGSIGTSPLPGEGGHGGYPNGLEGRDGDNKFGGGGKGGTQTAGGVGGYGPVNYGTAGTLGQGGTGAVAVLYYGGAGGGGGYYGGGGGGESTSTTSANSGGAGGGGSSYGPAGATFQTGVRIGNGVVTLSYTQADTLAPVSNPSHTPAPNANGWNNTDVTVTWNWTDPSTSSGGGSGLDAAHCTTSSTNSGEGTLTLSATCRDLAGNEAIALYGVRVDKTSPTANPSRQPPANANGWHNTDVVITWNWSDSGSGLDPATCPATSTLSGEGVFQPILNCFDLAGNNIAFNEVVNVDKTAPVVAVTGVSNSATYPLGSVPTAGCSTSDAISGEATLATLSVTGGNPDGTGTFTATCSGATDVAGNSAAPVSVSYTVEAPTPTPTNTPIPPTATPTNTPVPPTPTSTNTPVPLTPTPTNTAVPPTPNATNTPAADACTAMGLRDSFNRANGGLGSNWAGATNQSFYKIAGNQVDVQLGGPVVWKPTTFGVNQAVFVTLSTFDAASPSQGLLLKVQGSTIPNAGAIAVVYDNLAKAVRVSTLRLNTPAWTVYPHVPVTFANGDKLGGCVQADGTVRVYQNNSLLVTVTLNAADQSFFNAKGGKIGLWSVAAPNAFFDDFGGGALDGVSSAALDEAVSVVADETAGVVVDETAIPVVDETVVALTDPNLLVNRIFLPLVSR